MEYEVGYLVYFDLNEKYPGKVEMLVVHGTWW